MPRKASSNVPYLHMLSPRAFEASSGLVTFKAPGNVCFEMGRQLSEKYHIKVRLIPHYNAVRISTAHFNREEDYDQFFVALDHIVRGL